MFFFLVVAQELIRTPTTGYPQNRENYLEFLPAGKTRGIKKCGKIQGKHREFVCLRSKFIAYGGGYIGPLLNTTVIQHAIFAHNTQGNFLNKTGKI